MTVDELVKSILHGKDVEVYDSERILMIIKNVSKGYGSVDIQKNKVVISFTSGRSSTIRYHISYDLLNEEQENTIKKKKNES